MEAAGLGKRPGMTRTLPLACALVLALAGAAHAGVPHTVQPGETLWTIAAQNNFTTRALAAANGLSETSNVVLGSTIMIPSEAEAAAALASAAPAAPAAQQPAQGSSSGGGGGHTVQPGETLSGIAARLGVSQSALAAANGLAYDGWVIAGTTLKVPAAGSAAPSQSQGPPPMGAYKVRPGDTLSGIAAAAGVAREQIAWMNGIDPNGYVIEGTVLKLPTGASGPQASEPAPAKTVVPQAGPAPTAEFVDHGTVARIAAEHRVSPSLASAIAYQESGFNNNLVSSANARGVMQILPGTWDWINQNLASNPLNPNSALDNVHAGVLYLRQLVDEFGGDENAAAAAYYQGAGAVRSRGLFDDTKQYVNSVNALRGRFGG